jgi:hypothetical protein
VQQPGIASISGFVGLKYDLFQDYIMSLCHELKMKAHNDYLKKKRLKVNLIKVTKE